jgi:hypothetical protein
MRRSGPAQTQSGGGYTPIVMILQRALCNSCDCAFDSLYALGRLANSLPHRCPALDRKRATRTHPACPDIEPSIRLVTRMALTFAPLHPMAPHCAP